MNRSKYIENVYKLKIRVQTNNYIEYEPHKEVAWNGTRSLIIVHKDLMPDGSWRRGHTQVNLGKSLEVPNE